MKKYVFLLIITFIVILIYFYTKTTKKTYLVLGISDDSEYIINQKQKLINNNELNYYNILFLDKKNRITDVINDIKYKKEINGKTIQNYIIKSDYITLNIGYNDFNSILDDQNIYENIDKIMVDLEELFKLIRKYCKEEIEFLEIKTNSKIDKYLETQIKKLCTKYKIKYIS